MTRRTSVPGGRALIDDSAARRLGSVTDPLESACNWTTTDAEMGTLGVGLCRSVHEGIGVTPEGEVQVVQGVGHDPETDIGKTIDSHGQVGEPDGDLGAACSMPAADGTEADVEGSAAADVVAATCAVR